MAQNIHTPVTDEVGTYDLGLRLEHASGSEVWFQGDSRPYTDLIMAYSSTNFGHCNPRIVEAVQAAAIRADNIISFNDPQRDELSERLISKLPFEAINFQVYYAVGGAKGVDSAIKIARVASGKPGIVTFTGAFHGMATSLTGITDPRFVSPAYAPFGDKNAHALPFPAIGSNVNVHDVINKLTELIQSGEVGTVIIEPIQGAAGFLQAPSEFFNLLQAVISKYKTILIVDDIQMGMGRIGSFYSFGNYGLKPDMVLLGKSMAGGYYPLTALIGRKALFDGVGGNRSGLDSTFSNNAFGIQIANSVTALYDDLQIDEKVAALAPEFKRIVHSLRAKYSEIVSVSIIGLAVSLEFEDKKIATKIKDAAFSNRLIIQTAGTDSNFVKLSPCLLITQHDLQQAMETLDRSMSECLAVV